MLIALRKYASILMLLTMSTYLVCAVSDDFCDSGLMQIEMLANAEVDADDFDDNEEPDFVFDSPSSPYNAINRLDNTVLCGEIQTVAKRSSAQLLGLVHNLAPNREADSYARFFFENNKVVRTSVFTTFFYLSINLNSSKNEKSFFSYAFGGRCRLKRVLG